jgi:aminoglycoside phosphotransferase (APT) family kinase protein
MHEDQVDVPVDVVAALVAAQFPQWRDRPVRRVLSHGTVNALFRLGDDVVVRFPLRPSLDAALREELLREQEDARRIAPYLPLPVPEPLGLGAPGEGYPGPWAAYRWIPGGTADLRDIADPDGFARDLAGFVIALRAIGTGDRVRDGHSRGGPLRAHDAYVRQCLAQSTHLVDTVRLAEIWARTLDAAPHDGSPVWIHADLMPGNLLTRNGRLAAVIDLGTLTAGDPAVDLMPAWNLLPAGGRRTYREALGTDDAAWERGRGWSLLQAIGALPYYEHTNPIMAATAQHTLTALLG